MAVITVSRQSGSDGDAVTRLLCERLGYRYFDKKLMAELAQEMGIDPREIVDVSADKHQAKGILERIFGNFQTPFGDPSSWTLAARHDAHEALSVERVRSMIEAAYEQGDVVIIGRGGQIALAGKPDVLHVRIVAPFETRVRRWQARAVLSEEDAQQRTRERDQAHIDFVQRFYGADIADPALYDLVISTEKITPEGAVELIVKALELLQ
ncbi:MAG: cytidylate kinase-like family protein [Anaerolineae bacterium]|jgi:cytidylate kinase|nr:cytidylate kinase-like family protein [Anaerolineae bacterium]